GAAHGLGRWTIAARALSGASVVFDVVAFLTALVWLTSRKKPETPWIARAALVIGCVVAYGAMRGAREGAPLWELVANRALDRLVAGAPAVLVWPTARALLEICSPFLAAAALAARGQMPAIIGSFALALIARPSTDVPLSALALTLAALSAPLA